MSDRRRVSQSGVSCQDPTFEAIAPRLEKNFYQPIPIKPATKVPSVPGWQTIKSSTHYIKAKKCGKDGVGLLTAATPAIDIDVRDEALVKDLINLSDDLFEQHAPIRIGSPPKALLLFRAETLFDKKFGSWFVMPGDNWRDNNYRAHRIEVLATGQMFVAYAKHPTTGKEYKWSRGDPLNTYSQDLPLISESLADLYLEEAWRVCFQHGALPVKQRKRQWCAGPLPGIEEEKAKTIAWWKALSIEDLKEPLGLKRSGRGWACRCPVHVGEHDNSLNIFESKEDGTLLAHCYAGCSFEDISEAICSTLDEMIEGIE